MVFLAGVFVFSAQVLVYAFTSAPPAAGARHRPRLAAGVGRVGAICGPLLGGAVLSAGLAFPWGFYAFAVVGALGAVALSVSRVRRPDATEPLGTGGREGVAAGAAPTAHRTGSAG